MDLPRTGIYCGGGNRKAIRVGKLIQNNMKAMSIIGIIWFSLSLICIVALIESNLQAATGWGILGLLYAIPYAIVGLVVSIKKSKSTVTQELLNLSSLKEKGVLTDDEFQAKKLDLLK